MAESGSAAKVKLIVAVVALLAGGVLILNALGVINIFGGGGAEVDEARLPDPEEAQRTLEEQEEQFEQMERRGQAERAGGA